MMDEVEEEEDGDEVPATPPSKKVNFKRFSLNNLTI